ncbi:MAG: FtsX-like permease family protein [Oscillospiraceae bacterium]|nr:FtsX-like permease family protein [Oscillospiraceae bacterium]
MRKIALRGLLGQKRNTLLLWSVVTLAFLFLVLSTTIITSLQKTDSDQRISTYGQWQVMVETGSLQQAEEYAATAQTAAIQPLVSVYGLDYFSGDNTYFLSPYTPEMEELGRLRLKEGRWPEAENEVALEYARLSALGLALGDSFRVVSEVYLPISEDAVLSQEGLLARARQQAIEAANQPLLAAFRDGSWRDMMGKNTGRPNMNGKMNDLFFRWWEGGEFRNYAHLFADEANPDGQQLRIADMTEEQLQTALGAFWELYSFALDITPYLSEEENHYLNGITDLIGYGERNMRVRIKDEQLLLIIPTTYTVCGVTETYSDRWDTGTFSSLPSGFITQANYDTLLACQQAAVEAYPDFNTVEYAHLVLTADHEPTAARAAWQRAAAVYNVQTAAPEQLYRTWFTQETSDGVETVQYCVQFRLADIKKEQAAAVTGWLVPAQTALKNIKGYQTDALLWDPADTDPGERVIAQWEVSPQELQEKTLSAGACIRFETDGRLYDIPVDQFFAGEFEIDGKIPVSSQYLWSTGYEEQTDSSVLRLNRFAYPPSAEGSSRMLVLVTIILFVTTVCAVFQIFFSQMRKRLRRIVLMKSIGAQDGQIARMLVWEFLYFLLGSLPLGTVLGLGSARLTTLLLARIQQRSITMHLSPAVFAAALAAGTLALAIGMAVPSIMAVGIPLTGRTVRKKPLPPPKKEERQDFLHVTLRGLFANRSRTLGSAALCVFTMLIGVLCVFLGVQFLTPWREAVQRNGKPEYLLRAPYSMSDRQQAEYLAGLEALGVCESIEVSRVSTDAIIAAEDAAGSVLLETAAMTGEVEDITGYYVTLHGISSDSGLFQKYTAAITEGTLDTAAYDRGEEVLLLVPLYQKTGLTDREALANAEGWARLDAAGIRTTYYPEYRLRYKQDRTVQAGDTVQLAAKTRMVSADPPGFSYNTKNLTTRVGAVIYYFPEEGIWPASGSGEGYHIVCAPHLAAKLLPNAIRTRTDSEIRAIKVGGLIDACGSTDFYINGAEGLSRETIDTALLVWARSNYMDIDFYHESNEKLLQDAINNILLTCLLGLTAVLLALIIFANTVASDIEQERNRIGILQSLGVSNRKLMLRQLYIGLAVSGTAVISANIVLWVFAQVYSLLSGKVMGHLLWHYPVWLHLGLCLLMAVIITALYLLPMYGLRRYLPIENIKSRK